MNAIAVTITAVDMVWDGRMPRKVVGGSSVEIRIVAVRTVLFENGSTKDDFLSVDNQGVPEWIDRSQIFSKEELVKKNTEKIVAHAG